MMAVCYFLEKTTNIVLDGWSIPAILFSVFLFAYLVGKVIKWIGLYDKQTYVGVEIDPYETEVLKAARLIIKHYEANEQT